MIENPQDDKNLKTLILNNSLILALNSQIFNFYDFMDTDLMNCKNSYETQKIYMKHQKYFQASSLFNGRSMAEHFLDNELILKGMKLFDYDLIEEKWIDDVKRES